MTDDHAPTKKPTDYDELFPGRFLKAGLFEKPVTLRITAVDREALPQDTGGEKTRGIISFHGTEMQLVLNSTNGQCLAAMFGRKVQDWVGHRVTLQKERDKFGRDDVDCIRVAGSPDIEADISVEIRLPKKKPRTRKLTRTAKGKTDPDRDGKEE